MEKCHFKLCLGLAIAGTDLTISALKTGMKEENGANFRRIERFTGNISRGKESTIFLTCKNIIICLPLVIALPDNVNTSQIEANCNNGVLHITIPKLHHDEHEQHITNIEIL